MAAFFFNYYAGAAAAAVFLDSADAAVFDNVRRYLGLPAAPRSETRGTVSARKFERKSESAFLNKS